MKYLLCLGLLLLCATHQAYPLFDHDRAVVAAHQGDWQQALHLMQQEVTHHPDDAQVLYDAGVAAYKQGHYQQAQAYFNNAAALSSQAYQPLLEQEALFNAGNSYVKLNQLEDAIKSYETLLARDQHHDKARHNLEVVKKMLEQQKQQQKKEEQEKKDKENQEQDEQDDEPKDDQQKDKDDKQQQQNSKNNQQKSGNNKQDKKESGDKKKNDQQGDDERDQRDGQKDKEEQDKQHGQQQQQQQSQKEEKQSQSESQANKDKQDKQQQ